MRYNASIAKKLNSQLLTGDKKDLLFVSIIYCLAHGLILFNSGIFWDDWAYFFEYNKSTLVSMFFQQGTPGAGYLYSFLISLPNSITLMRAVIFASFLLTALLLYAILKTVKEIDRASRFVLVVIFAVFPVNSARIALVCFLYAIAYLTFFLSFWLTSKYLNKKNLLLRVLALVGFFISFAVNSLLFFYVLVIVYIAYKEDCFRKFPPEIHRLVVVLLRYFDFVALPAVFWVVRSLFFRPYGIFAYYNIITLGSLMQVPSLLVNSFYTSFIQVLATSLGPLFPATTLRMLSTTIFVICCIVGLFLVAHAAVVWHPRLNSAFHRGRKYPIALLNTLTEWYRPAETQNETDIKLFVAGFLFFSIGVFPYLVVGKVPSFADWQSRHQLLIPLGASFLLFYGFKIASNRVVKSSFVKVSVISVIVTLFVIGNVVSYLDYQKDWFKEVSLIHNFKKSEEIKNHTTFLFDDKTANLNANNRIYRFYEYGGMLQYAFGDQSRFGSDRSTFNMSVDYLNSYKTHGYDAAYLGLRDYRRAGPDLAVTIGYSSYPLTNVNTLKLLYYERFDTDKFNETVDNIVTVQTHI